MECYAVAARFRLGRFFVADAKETIEQGSTPMDRISHDIILYILFIHVDEAVLVNVASRSCRRIKSPGQRSRFRYSSRSSQLRGKTVLVVGHAARCR